MVAYFCGSKHLLCYFKFSKEKKQKNKQQQKTKSLLHNLVNEQVRWKFKQEYFSNLFKAGANGQHVGQHFDQQTCWSGLLTAIQRRQKARYLDFRALFEVVGVYTFPKMGVKDAQYEKAFKELFEYNFALIFSQIGFEVSKLIIRTKSFSYS